MKQVSGGVCAAKGFVAAGVHCGVKASSSPDKNDLALILSEKECTAAATYTLNRVKAAPLYVTMDHLENGEAQGIVANSGNANACAPNSHEHAERMCELAAAATGLKASDFVVASTGVIGQTLNVAVIEQGMPELCAAAAHTAAGSDAAAHAIMTTDTVKKELAVETVIGGKTVRMGGIAKGSGMIHPNMCTMLGFLTTDVNISKELLQEALSDNVKDTYNMVSVDGDTSTNDTVLLLANGQAGNKEITEKNEDYSKFTEALGYVNTWLSKHIAADGEGATALFEVKVIHAESKEQAVTLSKSIITSNLTKAAIFGHDANWGRILCAMGYSGAKFDPEKVDLYFESAAGKLKIIEDGVATGYSEEEATKILSEKEVTAIADIKMGEAQAAAWGCDLTYDYVKINADYRS